MEYFGHPKKILNFILFSFSDFIDDIKQYIKQLYILNVDFTIGDRFTCSLIYENSLFGNIPNAGFDDILPQIFIRAYHNKCKMPIAIWNYMTDKTKAETLSLIIIHNLPELLQLVMPHIKYDVYVKQYLRIYAMKNKHAAFRISCEKGYLDIAKYVYSLRNAKDCIRAQNYYALRRSCKNNHIEIVKFLVEVGGQELISMNNYELFRKSCIRNYNVELTLWLLEQPSMRHISYATYFSLILKCDKLLCRSDDPDLEMIKDILSSKI